MENASRALLMAAGVLVGILVLTLAVYLFISFGTTSAELHKQNYEQQLEQFNSQFTVYEGKDDVTIYDVVTAANLATENNIYYEFEKRNAITDGKDNYITIKLDNNTLPGKYRGTIEKGYKYSGDIDYNELISEDIKFMNVAEGKLTQYTCKTEISKTTNRVYLVIFTKK